MPEIFLKNYLSELWNILDSVNPGEFDDLVEELIAAYERKAHIFVCGNGGSASTAGHFVGDINKGVSFGKEKKFRGICLSDNIATVMAYANDVSYHDIFVEQLKNFMDVADLIIGISGSGKSENILKAVLYANEHGGKTFGICGYGGGELKSLAQKSIVVNNNDMQKVEDVHFIILHCAMQYLERNGF